MLIHREALELAKNAQENLEGVPFATTCVYVDTEGRVTVCDGLHWLRMNAAVDEPNLFDELADKTAGADSDGPVLVPAEVMQAFNAAMKKRKSKKGMPVPHVVVRQRDKQITLASSDGKTQRTFLLDANDLEYPDVDKTVVAHEPIRSVVLSVDLLYKVVKALRSCKAVSVRLGLPVSDDAPISLSCDTITGSIRGAVMPMRDREEAEQPAPRTSGVDETHVSLTDTETGEVLFEGSGSDLTRAAKAIANTGALNP